MAIGYRKTTETLIELPELPENAPHIIDDFSLAHTIGLRNKTMWYILRNTKKFYKKLYIPKKSGGQRVIHAPSPLMLYCQTQILNHILNPLQEELGEHVTAYRKNRSIVQAVRNHIPACIICAKSPPGITPKKHACPRRGTHIQVDLKNFFQTTRSAWIRNYFKGLGYSHYVSGLLGSLMTTKDLPNPKYQKYPDEPKYKTRVPQGSPASGAICNLVADVQLDTPMLQYLKNLNNVYKLTGENVWVYTRYSDDLCFTCGIPLSPKDQIKVLGGIYAVIKQAGYLPNKEKTRVVTGYKKRRSLGVIFNDKPNLPKPVARKLRAIVYNCATKGFETQITASKKENVGELYTWVLGYTNWLASVNPDKGAPLLAQIKHTAQTQGVV
jgi:hypothetical protein